MSHTLTDQQKEAISDSLTDLIAIVRDQELGYRTQELHKDPKTTLEEADKALEALGIDPNEVIWEDDRAKLGLPQPPENSEATAT